MPTYNQNDPYRPLFGSLSDRKSVALAGKYKEKKEHLEPTPAPPPQEFVSSLARDGGGNSNLLDVAQSSAVQGMGSLADMGKYASNAILGTEFDDSMGAGWSDQAVADEMTGVSQEIRDEGQALQGNVSNAVAEGRYGDAALDALRAAPYTAADSAGTLLELGLGAAATAATGGGAGLLFGAKKVKDLSSAAIKAKKAVEATQKLKDATRLGKALKTAKNLPAATAKTAGQASLLTADMTMQSRDEYFQKHGEYPSGERMATMALTNMATSMLEPMLITKLFIPKFKTELGKEIVNLAQNLGKGSNLAHIGKRIGEGIGKMTAAGAGEAMQEYVQTWQQGLVANLTPEQTDDLWNSVKAELSDKDKQNEAIVGGLLGMGAGGVTRGVISAPSVAVGTAVDATKATAKGAYKTAKFGSKVVKNVAQYYGNKAGMKLLSEEDQAIVAENFETRNKVFKEKVEEMDAYVDTVNKAKTFEEIYSNPDLVDVANRAQDELKLTDEQLNDPKNLSKIQDKIARQFKAAELGLKAELKLTTLGQVGKKVTENVAKAGKKAYTDVKNSPEMAKAVASVEKYGTATVEAVKEIRSSTALGVIELGMKNTKEASREAYMKSKKLNVPDLQRSIMALEGDNKPLSKQMTKLMEQKKRYQEKLGVISDDLVNDDNLSPIIKEVTAAKAITSAQATKVAMEVKRTIGMRISDKATLAKVEQAVELYKGTDQYINQTEGSIRPNNLKQYEATLNKAKARLGRELTGENVGEAAGKVVKAAKDTASYVGGKAADATNAAEKAFNDANDSELAGKVKGKVKDVADKVVNAADELAEKTADKIDEKIDQVEKNQEDKAVKAEKRKALVAKLDGIKDLFSSPEAAEGMAQNIPALVTSMINAGIETKEDLDGFIKENKFLGQDTAFHSKLQAEFDQTSPNTDENAVVMTENKLNTEEDVKPVDGSLVTMFKKILGCPL